MDWFNSAEPAPGGKTTPLRVSEVSAIVEDLLDDGRLQGIWVRGEITNYTHHSRGHRYFSLSEKGPGGTAAVIKCVMWRSAAAGLSFSPEDGMEVIVSASVRHYAPHGIYQLQVEEILRAGIGEKYLLVERWKKELSAEGCFGPERKRPLPPFPVRVGVVTSETGAVIHDIRNVIGRRFPVEIVLSPTAVQGEGIQADIARAICRLADMVDVVIVARGGGSFEDLFPFNHPDVVRAIVHCPVPVISAIGHEVDVTLADLAADMRAPTPSAAAELAVPDKSVLNEGLATLRCQLLAVLNGRLQRAKEITEDLRDRLRPLRILRKIHERKQDVAELAERSERAVRGRIGNNRLALSGLSAALDATSPLRILARGYGVVEREGHVVRSTEGIVQGERLLLRFVDGRVQVTVERVEHGRNV
ncbi:MAG TPA: exodeoxyribonuclease VII large subunit [Methanoregulaceae archaeon]|nr:exodeoxyribonuclease VII large subunit [Methanoregulaceae archaeon]HPD74580.1 exodeoxyribonuclease VII large subunit [Methanoregulaceae archaeon]HRY74852.1 exodeoxyribonuclease VII large subunit [Methanoregulaceae archaeon]